MLNLDTDDMMTFKIRERKKNSLTDSYPEFHPNSICK